MKGGEKLVLPLQDGERRPKTREPARGVLWPALKWIFFTGGIRHVRASGMKFRHPAEISDVSGSTVKADDDLAGFDDHRHAPLALGMLQHLGQLDFIL
jgi:hypothetical protein